MDEKTALEEIQFIRQVIEQSKRNILYNGIDYIFWGVIVIAGMLFQYISILNHVRLNYMILWMVVISVGWAWSLYNGRKQNLEKSRTYPGKILMYLWIGTGIGATIIGFLGVAAKAISPMVISPCISIMVGSAYFVTGKIVESKWFSNLAFGWWAGAVLMFYVMNVHQFLIMALMMLFLQTIPGIIVYRKYKRERVEAV